MNVFDAKDQFSSPPVENVMILGFVVAISQIVSLKVHKTLDRTLALHIHQQFRHPHKSG